MTSSLKFISQCFLALLTLPSILPQFCPHSFPLVSFNFLSIMLQNNYHKNFREMMKLFLLGRGKPSKLILSSSPQHLEYWIEICILRVPRCLSMQNRCFISQVFPIYYTWYLYLCEKNTALGNSLSIFLPSKLVHGNVLLSQLPFSSGEEAFLVLFIFLQGHQGETSAVPCSYFCTCHFPTQNAFSWVYLSCKAWLNFTSFVKLMNLTWSDSSFFKQLNSICCCYCFHHHH